MSILSIDAAATVLLDTVRQARAKPEADSPRIWSPPILQDKTALITVTGLRPYIRPVHEVAYRTSGLDEMRAYCPYRAIVL